MKNHILNWWGYLLISFTWFLSLIYGMDNMRRLAKKLEGESNEKSNGTSRICS